MADILAIIPAAPSCPRHQCEQCGRYVAKATVLHGEGYDGIDYDYWATGECKACGSVYVVCVP